MTGYFIEEAKLGAASLKERFKAEADAIRELHFAGAGGMDVVKRNTALMDRVIGSVYHDVCRRFGLPPDGTGLTIAAVGGYGRGELNPHSDVDILFLCTDRENVGDGSGGADGDAVTSALHMMWDLGLDLGYSVRSAQQCCDLAADDYTILTGLLETRYLCGSRKLFDSLIAKLEERRKPKDIEEYIRQKLVERSASRKKHGESVFLREPNIKEGAGGLRDIHTALWITKFKYGIGAIDGLMGRELARDSELRRLKGTRDYLLRLRNEIHYISGHKQDVLTFELQESAAEDFGYRHKAGRMAVENFMRAYYLRARGVREISRKIIDNSLDKKAAKRWFFLPPTKKRLDDDFYVMGRALCMDEDSAKEIADRPELVMTAFAHYQSQGVPFSAHLKDTLSENVRAVKKSSPGSPDMGHAFQEILGRHERVYDTLEMMHSMKVLGRFLPEFGAISALVQHDMYHKYTVDEHSLLVVRKVQDLGGIDGAKYPELAEAANRVTDRRTMMLTALLHDCGKALGGGHSERGAELVHEVAARLCMEPGRAELMESLVRNHLIMAHISQRRELSDTAVLEKFCRIVDTREKLDMLYVLTYADMDSVGPDVFNQWRRVLLRELYERASVYLEDKSSVVAYEKRQLASKEEAVVKSGVKGRAGTEKEIRAFLKNLPPRYLLSMTEDSVVNHFRLTKGMKAHDVVIDYEQDDGGFTNLTIVAYDTLGLFYLSAGALASRNMNILNANIFTGRDGMMIDTLQVTDNNKLPVTDEDTWEDIKDGLVNALTGRSRLDRILPPKNVYRKRTSLTVNPPRVAVDNETSDRFTVIEVYAHDRVGLLYDITKTLFSLNCYISSAKVDTDVDQVVDVFYISDIFKDKIWDPVRVKGIRDAITAAVAPVDK